VITVCEKCWGEIYEPGDVPGIDFECGDIKKIILQRLRHTPCMCSKEPPQIVTDTPKSPPRSRWVPNIKGGPGTNFEISVLREDNALGKTSYGWDGPDKIVVSATGGIKNKKFAARIYAKLVRTAAEIAEELNTLENPDEQNR